MLLNADERILSSGITAMRASAGHFVVGTSPEMRSLDRVITDVATTDIPVLLAGESGTGKEVVAMEIHRRSRRQNEPFMKCNCGGLTAESLSAHLAAKQDTRGRDGVGGTVFLDEISQLDAANQTRLLHLLPDGDGVPAERCLGARVISATTRNIEEEMRAGRFREELFYRINGMYLRLPPLRHRKEDIPLLLDCFFKKYASLFGRLEPRLGQATLELLMQHNWPGNVRELENVARKFVALGDEQLALSDFVAGSAPVATPVASPVAEAVPAPAGRSGLRSLKEASREASRKTERELILKALEHTRWNRKRTARELQISYKALLYKLKQLGLDGTKDSDPAEEMG